MSSIFVISADGSFGEQKDYTAVLPSSRSPVMDLDKAQKLIGGYLEIVPREKESCRVIAFVNDEGLLRELPTNKLAAKVLPYLNCRPMRNIYGNVILCGERGLGIEHSMAVILEELCNWFKDHDEEPDLKDEQLTELFIGRGAHAAPDDEESSSPSSGDDSDWSWTTSSSESEEEEEEGDTVTVCYLANAKKDDAPAAPAGPQTPPCKKAKHSE